MKVNNMMIGSSISCDGVCLTLRSYKKKILYFYLSKEDNKKIKFFKNKKIKLLI